MSVTHDEVFPFGAFLMGEVTSISDYDRSTKDNKVQAIDKDTGLPLWAIDVLDADPEARRASKMMSIKFAAKVQPVPPANDAGTPFTPVVFEGLTALPYVETVGENFTRIAWSMRAGGMLTAKQAAKSSASGSASSASGSASSGSGSSSSGSSSSAAA
jgi:uncharacterized membrane protein YgcG